MDTSELRVLFICTGNSARSQMAEAMLRHLSKGKIEVHSAGSDPRPDIHPYAVQVIRDEFGIGMDGQHPKPISAYLGQRFDYIIAVCNKAAEACPVFPGDPERINWFYDDPAALQGTPEQQYAAFRTVARQMMMRMRTWLELPVISRNLKEPAPSASNA